MVVSGLSGGGGGAACVVLLGGGPGVVVVHYNPCLVWLGLYGFGTTMFRVAQNLGATCLLYNTSDVRWP